MSETPQRLARLLTALTLALAAAAGASERSQLLVAQGQAAYQADRFAEARDRFAEAVSADADDPAAHYGLGLALAKLERWEEAASPLERAIALRADFEEARRALGLVDHHLGRAALERGEYERAATLLERAAELAPAEGARSRYLAGIARFRAGRMAEARADFEAAARSPEREIADAAADYLEQLARGAAAPPVKRWEVRAASGIQYDSNVPLAPHSARGDRDDAAFILGAGGRYDLVQRERALVRFDYDFYQTLHPDLRDFDFRSNHISGTASYGLWRWLWAGVQGGYNHYALDGHQYEHEPFVLPFLSLAEGREARTQVFYRHGEPDYLSAPFKGVRDGQTNGAGVTQLFLFAGGARYLTLGYAYENEDPRSARGDDFARDSNQGHVGVGFPAWWQTAVELLYVYRNDDYTEPNSLAGFRKTRDDDEHLFYAGLRRGLTDHLDVTLGYHAIVNRSNIGIFDYRRHVVALLFEVRY